MDRYSFTATDFHLPPADLPRRIAAQRLAYTLPYRRFANVLEDACARIGGDVDWSGRIEARTGLRMMPTFPPIIPYGGFSPIRLEGWLFRWRLPGFHASLSLLPTFAACLPVCIHPSYTS